MLLQSSALLLHHTLAPHHHQLAAATPGGMHDEHGHSAPGHGKKPAPCPVWTALQQIGGGLIGVANPIVLLVFAPLVLLAVAPLPPRRRLALSAQPRGPPAPI
jgi:hypothetical protein